MMAWGNPTPISLMRRKNMIETLRLRARIRDLEADNAALRARLEHSATYHHSACRFWRGSECSCGPAAMTATVL